LLSNAARCRGIALGDGEYTRCAYGAGALRSITGPRDCPVCSGSGYEDFVANLTFPVRPSAILVTYYFPT
jgi:hypothetical protein